MDRYLVVFTPEAEAQLEALYHHLAVEGFPQVAARYVDAVIDHCEKLELFPVRGLLRDDIRPGLRLTNYRKHTIIAFTIEADRVVIVGVFHGGQNYEAALADE
ncbi:type II toxin-antitoxin system RelE/ParE family toxin [Flagellatimonas centrodinii]|uniref:type II toxin-antitoxin system RelE/ParE family toxin n=1 Tax=Flagellatimonas centrodinii TaxID=2806210 RepID=UPI001FF029DD|nr:type II toxin-antitoxin system RelE/ParE family toxin [Flagellatimonas centrodinii]ULQ45550.1 type II toxin-antitoxin system RelE/ParE family toxin [Flagellatimonas centrodinii]